MPFIFACPSFLGANKGCGKKRKEKKVEKYLDKMVEHRARIRNGGLRCASIGELEGETFREASR